MNPVSPVIGDTILVFNTDNYNKRQFNCGYTKEIIINDTKYTYQFKTGFVKKDMRFKTWFFNEEDQNNLEYY
tara:strand:+ start:348 stop:563 length:216 start_codon:yes stop_codon:yes gene_type:complete